MGVQVFCSSDFWCTMGAVWLRWREKSIIAGARTWLAMLAHVDRLTMAEPENAKRCLFTKFCDKMAAVNV